MTQTTNNHDGAADNSGQPVGPDSTGYTWARRSDLAPPAPASSESDPADQAPAGRAPSVGYPTSPAPGQPLAAPAAPGYGSWARPSGEAPSAYAPSGHPNQPGDGSVNPPPPSPYAMSATATQPVATSAPPIPGGTSTMPFPNYTDPAPAGNPGQGGGSFYPPAPPHRREPRRPGWTGVVAMGVGAALLSSGLTVGLLRATDDGSVTTTTSSQSAPQVKGPVTTSTDANPDWNAVASAVEPSIVAVTVTSQSAEGEGSGVILDKEGRIVTNNHVVSGAGTGASVKVTLSDGRGYDASVVGTDPTTDLAVIKISNPPSDLTPATLGSSESAKVGDAVMAVGNPLGLAGTVTTGIISSLDRPVTTAAESTDASAGDNESVITNAIQTDAAVNPGNSGGALVDSQGRVIGIPSSIASLGSSSPFGGSASQSGSIGLGFAIPIDEVKDVTAQLIAGKTVQHSYLGVQLKADGTVTVNGASRTAAMLASVESDGPAEKAGLKAGDAIIAVDGEPVNGVESLIGQLRQRTPDTAVKLSVVRNGKAQDITVTLGTKPATTG